MNESGIFKIALFPIPGCVCFPQTVVPLHVFEPRYRLMIQECVNNKVLLGVCHTKSIERFAYTQTRKIKSKNELYQQYKQNLTTFAPEDIFSAGLVEINRITEDGRYHVSILMLKRFRILELIQNDPYKIAQCEEYLDDKIISFNDVEARVRSERQLILNFISQELSKIGQPDNEELTDLENESSLNLFTFKLFKFFRLPENSMQEMLNLKDSLQRFDHLHKFILSLKNSLP